MTKKIIGVIIYTIIYYLLSSVVGANFNPFEWNNFWRLFSVVVYVVLLEDVLEKLEDR